MTALAGPTDAELVPRVLAADREAFAAVYDRYGPRLYDFAYSMLRHREDASDAVADSFVTFAERLSQLRDPDRLRPWLYAIVRSECLRRLKARKRFASADDEQLTEMADAAIGPDEAAQQSALRQLVWDAAAGLADRDRALLDLHLRQGLEGAELGEAMGVSAANAYVMLNRLRAQVDRSLGALLIARLGREDCEELDELLADWDGGFSVLIRKRVARHVEKCSVCSERRKKLVSPWMLLASVPLFAAPATLRDRVLEDTHLVAHATAVGAAAGSGGGSAAARRRWATFAAIVLLVLAMLAAVLLLPDNDAATPQSDDPVGTPTATAPSTAPTSAPTGPSSEPTTSPNPTASPTPTPSPSPTPTPSATAGVLPGSLSVSTRSILLGETGTRGTVRVGNTGEADLTFEIDPRTPWLSASLADGSLAGGVSTDVVLQAARSGLPEGRSTGSVLISGGGRSVEVIVTLVVERDPVVGRPTTPSNPSCDDIPVSVAVSDESGVESVALSWTGVGGTGTSRMELVSGTWRATMGPFSQGGNVTMRVTARDMRGNAASSTRTVYVLPCPG